MLSGENKTGRKGPRKQQKISCSIAMSSRRATHSLMAYIDQLRVGGKEVEREGILHFLSMSRTALGHEEFPLNSVNMFPRQRIYTQQ